MADASPLAAAAPDVAPRARRIGARQILRALLRDPVILAATLVLLVIAAFAILAEWIAPHDPLRQELFARNVPPLGTAEVRGQTQFHLLGTDPLGRDLFSRIVFGARVSVAVSLLGATAAMLVGVTLGLLAGYYRGLAEGAIMRLVDGFMAVPSLLTALFVLFLFGGGFLNLVLVFALVRWMVYARMTRAMVLQYREGALVEAARAVGASDARILFVHILPNLASPLIVLFTLEVAILIIAEASLSFLGFGIQPPEPSWGGMIARGREDMRTVWWPVAFPGLMIFLTALSLNLLAGWLRVVSDPVQRWRWLL